MSRLRHMLIAPACLLTLAGCLDNVSVQNRYNQERDQCRGDAEERFNSALGDNADGMGDRARNTELATLFSKCMSARGWTVATPNRGKKVADAKPFPGQTTPPPVNAATVAPVPVPLIMPPGYVPYGAAPPGYAPMMAPPPGAVMMAPQPVPGMVAPPPMAQPYPNAMPPAPVSEPVPQPAPRPVAASRAPRANRTPLPADTNAQDVLDRQLTSPTGRP